jgi:hypothetical protein
VQHVIGCLIGLPPVNHFLMQDNAIVVNDIRSPQSTVARFRLEKNARETGRYRQPAELQEPNEV